VGEEGFFIAKNDVIANLKAGIQVQKKTQ